MADGGWTAKVLDELMAATGVAMDRGVRARHLLATDWGQVAASNPPAVARPSTADQAAAVVRFASGRGLSVTARGTGGTEGGQTVAHDSIVLETLNLDDVGEVDAADKTVACGPGATWRAVLTETLPRGLTPPVVPLGLDCTVGGVLATGGCGSTSHRFGASVSNVVELEVATGAGRVVTCSAATEPDLFHAVLAGLGRVGLITRAKLSLVEVGPTAHVAKVHYDDVATWLADMEKARTAPGITHVETFAPRAGYGAQFDLTVAADGPGARPEDVEKVVAELTPSRVDDVYEATAMEFACRLDPRLENLIRGGRAGQLHPWVESFITVEALGRIVPDMLAEAAGDMNDKMHIVLVDSAKLPPLLASPRDGIIACSVVAPVGIPNDELDDALARMRKVHDLVVDNGGKRYYTGWIPDPSPEAWRAHLGPAYDGWVAAKQAYDPGGVFTSDLLAGAEAPQA